MKQLISRTPIALRAAAAWCRLYVKNVSSKNQKKEIKFRCLSRTKKSKKPKNKISLAVVLLFLTLLAYMNEQCSISAVGSLDCWKNISNLAVTKIP